MSFSKVDPKTFLTSKTILGIIMACVAHYGSQPLTELRLNWEQNAIFGLSAAVAIWGRCVANRRIKV